MNKLINIKYDMKGLKIINSTARGRHPDEDLNREVRAGANYDNDPQTGKRFVAGLTLLCKDAEIYKFMYSKPNKIFLTSPSSQMYIDTFTSDYKTIYETLTGLKYKFQDGTYHVTVNGQDFSFDNDQRYLELDLYPTKDLLTNRFSFKGA